MYVSMSKVNWDVCSALGKKSKHFKLYYRQHSKKIDRLYIIELSYVKYIFEI
jgi:hypothetical protein